MSFGGAVKLTGESEYQKALKQITQNLKEVSSQMKVTTSMYDKNDNSMESLSAKSKDLNNQLTQQAQKVKILENQYATLQAKNTENIHSHLQLYQQLKNAKAELEQIAKTSGTTSKEYEEQAKKVKTLESDYAKSSKAIEQNKTVMSNARIEVNKAQAEYNKTATQVDKLDKEMQEASKSTDSLGKEMKETTAEVKKSGDGFTVFKGILANLGTQAINGAINGLKSLGSTIINIGKQAVQSFADYEQLVGGVETLFGTGGIRSVEEYAKSVGSSVDEIQGKYNSLLKAQNQVLRDADNAYKTAGLSANEYMETVTSFSASLISSLNGDTEAAAKASNQAIIDMADNSNKMGTSIESIKNAYQGFAKQNYTMLDNLKLGYGGTKTEMERLLADAEKLSGVKYDISNLNDVYEAIHVVQTEMGITGTTAKEASETITGSVNAMKSAWKNVITALGDGGNDYFNEVLNNFVDSVITVGKNIIPVVQTIISRLGDMVGGILTELVPQLVEMIPPLITETLPILIESANTAITSILDVLPTIIDAIAQLIPQIVTTLVGMLPQLIDVGMKGLISLIQGITQAIPQLIAMLPTIIKTIVDTIISNFPLILKAGIDLLITLITGIAEAIPDLVAYIPEIISTIVSTLIENLPLIIDAAIQIILALITGLVQALPQLITMVPDIIISIVKTLAQSMPQIIQSGVTMIKNLWSGMASYLGTLISSVASIPKKIIETIKNGLSSVYDLGKNLVEGLWNGIKDMTSWVLDKIKGFGESILGGIKSFFGIASPSKLFKNEVGKYLAEGVGVGFADEMKEVSRDMQNAIPTSFDTGVDLNSDTSPLAYNSSTDMYSNNSTYNMLVQAFQEAMENMKIELDDEDVGKFVRKTVSDAIFT